jgi:hypothetical protein
MSFAMKKSGNVKTYFILDNGACPFIVDVSPSAVEVYIQKHIEWSDKPIPFERAKKVWSSSYERIFIGDNDLKDSRSAKKGMYPGNSILVETEPGKYAYIGHEIYSFETRDCEEIKKYYSPVGNSAVPYPYAVGETHAYFMLDKQTIPNDLLNLKEDAYGQFYGWTIKDEELRKTINKSKKKFKTKQIHKRHI